LEMWKGDALVLIENNAGKASNLGTTFEELAKIRQLVNNPDKIGFCLDTCHLFASGVWSGENWDEVYKNAKSLEIFDALRAVHVNNSVFPSGSKRDQHADLHDGCIPIERLAELLSLLKSLGLPMILETPTTTKSEIKVLRELIN
jgi:deoxyribonuclease-4